LVSKDYLFFLDGDGEGEGGINAGSICGTELMKLIASVPPIYAGAGNSCTGDFFKYPFTNSAHIRAGKEPPVTEVRPPIPFKD
jgi:hypothetical protein